MIPRAGERKHTRHDGLIIVIRVVIIQSRMTTLLVWGWHRTVQLLPVIRKIKKNYHVMEKQEEDLVVMNTMMMSVFSICTELMRSNGLQHSGCLYYTHCTVL